MENFRKYGKFLILTAIIFILSGCCEWFPTAPWCPGDEPEIREFSFTPAAMRRKCPTHVGGDREFAGHGPDVTVRADIEKRNGDREIWVVVYLHAKETRSDWTEAEDTWTERVYSAPPGFKVMSIDSDMSSNAQYRDTDHSLDRPAVQGGNLVSKFEVMGDTRGNDVGNCTAGDVYLNVDFNEVRGKLIEE